MRIIFSVLLVIFLSYSVRAQIEFSGSFSVEFPTGDMKEIYSTAPGISISGGNYTEKRKGFSYFGAEIGIIRFNPRQDEFTYQLNGDDLRLTSYDPYVVIPISLLLRGGWKMGQKSQLFYGLDAGYYFTKWGYESNDPSRKTSDQINETTVGGKFHLGWRYQVNDQMALAWKSGVRGIIGRESMKDHVMHSHGVELVMRF
jgi:hypothetical protein